MIAVEVELIPLSPESEPSSYARQGISGEWYRVVPPSAVTEYHVGMQAHGIKVRAVDYIQGNVRLGRVET